MNNKKNKKGMDEGREGNKSQRADTYYSSALLLLFLLFIFASHRSSNGTNQERRFDDNRNSMWPDLDDFLKNRARFKLFVKIEQTFEQFLKWHLLLPLGPLRFNDGRFRHFGTTLRNFGHFERVHLVFGNILNLFWQNKQSSNLVTLNRIVLALDYCVWIVT